MRISLEDLSFRAFHGLYSQEKENGNEFHVTVHIDFEQDGVFYNDEIGKTIDYAEVYQLISSEMTEPRGLLEAVAMRMAENILSKFNLADSVTLLISKLNPPIGGPCGKATVTHRVSRRPS